MKTLKKYILLIFLIENLLAQSPVGGSLQWLFYIMLVAGAYLMITGGLFKPETFRKCRPLYLLGAVYIAYQFTLGFNTISTSTLIYLIAKVTTFVIIVVSVVDDWDFYARKVPFYFSIVVFFVLLFGLNNADTLNTTDRLELGFGNTNSTSSLSAFCVATVLFFWNRKHAILYTIIALVALYSMLAGGGRNAILMLTIMLLIWTGLSVKRVFLAASLICLLMLTINVFSLNLAGVERLEATISGDAGTNRDIERLATQMMIDARPYTGWGFGATNVGAAADLSELGSHNGYLETIKFMGYPFAVLYFLILFCSVIPMLSYYRSRDMAIRYHLAIVLSHFAGALFEGLYVGVHEFSTNVIFYSLAVLTTYRYNVEMQSYSGVQPLISKYDKNN